MLIFLLYLIKKMKFLNKKLLFETNLAMSDVLKRLQFNVESRKNAKHNLFGIKTDKLYIGNIEGYNFKINRINYNGKESFDIEGFIKEKQNKTIISVNLKATSIMWFFYYVFLTFILVNFIIFFLSLNLYTLIPIGFLMLIILVLNLDFYFEINQTKKNFKKFFLAENIS